MATRVLSQYPEGSQVRDAYGKTALDYGECEETPKLPTDVFVVVVQTEMELKTMAIVSNRSFEPPCCDGHTIATPILCVRQCRHCVVKVFLACLIF